MKTFLYSPLHRGWLALMVATILGCTVRIGAGIGLIAGSTTLLIAYLIARVVLLNFMVLRHAPRVSGVPCSKAGCCYCRYFLLCAY